MVRQPWRLDARGQRIFDAALVAGLLLPVAAMALAGVSAADVLLSVGETALGALFAWVGVQALVSQVVDEAPFVLPVGQLSLVVLGTGLAGLLAAVLPARRAARVSPAAGLAID